VWSVIAGVLLVMHLGNYYTTKQKTLDHANALQTMAAQHKFEAWRVGNTLQFKAFKWGKILDAIESVMDPVLHMAKTDKRKMGG
jgi:hypothetical protein